MGDFLTLAQLGLPVKVVVYDNSSLAFVAIEMKASGLIDTGTDLKNPNFAAMAEAAGIKGIRVEHSDQVEAALREAFAHPVINVNYSCRVPTTILAGRRPVGGPPLRRRGGPVRGGIIRLSHGRSCRHGAGWGLLSLVV